MTTEEVQELLLGADAQADCKGGNHYRLLIVGLGSLGSRVDRRSEWSNE